MEHEAENFHSSFTSTACWIVRKINAFRNFAHWYRYVDVVCACYASLNTLMKLGMFFLLLILSSQWGADAWSLILKFFTRLIFHINNFTHFEFFLFCWWFFASIYCRFQFLIRIFWSFFSLWCGERITLDKVERFWNKKWKSI